MTSVLAFVICDAFNGVQTYDELRSKGFIGNTLEKEYLSGAHGINGLINIVGNPPIKAFLEEQEFKVACVTTPWFQDGRLLVEPEAEIFFAVDEEEEHLLKFIDKGNVTQLFMPGDDEYLEYLSVNAKVSVAMVTSTYPIMPFDLLSALDPELVPKPKVKKASKASPPPQHISAASANIPPPPPVFQAQTPPPAPPTQPAQEQVSAPSPHGALLSGIRNMHKQFEESAKKARVTAPADNSKPLHKQMFGMF